MRFVILGNTRRKKLNFLHWNVCFFSFFQIILFSTTYRVFENWPLHLHQICLNTLWGVINLPWTSAKLDVTSKILKVFFFTGKVTFFRKFVFPSFTQLLQKGFFKLHIVAWISFGPMEMLHDVAILSNTRENKSKFSRR